MRSNLEGVDRSRVWGWAWDPDRPDEHVAVQVFVDDVLVGETQAATFRADLAAAGIGSGEAAFSLHFPRPISPARARTVRVMAGGAEVYGSPMVLPGMDSLSPEVASQLRAAVRAGFAQAFGPAQLEQAAVIVTSEIAAAMAIPAFAEGRSNVALVIDDRLPRATRDAGSQAVISHMRSLRRLGFNVVFIASSEAAAHDPEAAALLQSEGITCLDRVAVGGPGVALRGLRQAVSLVYLHRLSNAARWLAEARAWAPGARIVFSVADLHFLRLDRMAAVLGTWVEDAIRVAELDAVREADVVITHSQVEAELLGREVPEAVVRVVPWAVATRRLGVAFSERSGVAYVGSFGHPPNRDALMVLLDEVMPRVRTVAPEIKLLLAGSEMPGDLGLEGRPGVEVLGYVPDLADIFRRVRLTAAPLRFGAGLKGKVLDSFAYGLPCVCSPMAVEGLDLPDLLAGCVAEGAEATAELILRLHADESACAAIGAAGIAWVDENFNPSRIDAAMRKVL